LHAILEPLEIGLFAGKLDASKLDIFAKLGVKAMRCEQADWRDWQAIDSWAGKIYDRLEGTARSASKAFKAAAALKADTAQTANKSHRAVVR